VVARLLSTRWLIDPSVLGSNPSDPGSIKLKRGRPSGMDFCAKLASEKHRRKKCRLFENYNIVNKKVPVPTIPTPRVLYSAHVYFL
jgi:hypothetical protein